MKPERLEQAPQVPEYLDPKKVLVRQLETRLDQTEDQLLEVLLTPGHSMDEENKASLEFGLNYYVYWKTVNDYRSDHALEWLKDARSEIGRYVAAKPRDSHAEVLRDTIFFMPAPKNPKNKIILSTHYSKEYADIDINRYILGHVRDARKRAVGPIGQAYLDGQITIKS